MDVIHAWLLEELSGERFRILMQESQIGVSVAKMSGTNTMIDGHLSGSIALQKQPEKKLCIVFV